LMTRFDILKSHIITVSHINQYHNEQHFSNIKMIPSK